MHNDSTVTVLIVGYKSERWLGKCLSTLSSASRSRLQLCFVDNLQNPSLDQFDLSAFDVEIIKTPHPMGFSDANNYGLQHSQFDSDYTVFLNQDTVSTSGWIDKSVECLHENPQIGILSPGLRTYDLDAWEPNLVACITNAGLDAEQLDLETLIILPYVTAAAMVIRSELLNRVGPFDPIFGSYYEDYDLCRRVRNAGYLVAVCSPARVGHGDIWKH